MRRGTAATTENDIQLSGSVGILGVVDQEGNDLVNASEVASVVGPKDFHTELTQSNLGATMADLTSTESSFGRASLTSQIDGTKTVFTIPDSITSEWTVDARVNGVYQDNGNFTVDTSAHTLTLTTDAPLASPDTLVITYWHGGSPTGYLTDENGNWLVADDGSYLME
jgi:hypothetical protein